MIQKDKSFLLNKTTKIADEMSGDDIDVVRPQEGPTQLEQSIESFMAQKPPETIEFLLPSFELPSIHPIESFPSTKLEMDQKPVFSDPLSDSFLLTQILESTPLV